MMNDNIISGADILLYDGPDMSKFPVVACDQYTSQPDYWDDVKKIVGEGTSSLNMIFPEVYLKTLDFDEKVSSINHAMSNYLSSSLFEEYKDALIYTERKLRSGKVRCGIIGKIDLCEYDFNKGSKSPVRATEGTVLERIPPRVKIRENAPLELPHVILLIDDRKKYIIESLQNFKNEMKKVYDIDLMQNSGNITGYLIEGEIKEKLLSSLNRLSDINLFNEKYGTVSEKPLVYAVGDGNHSLATARQCYLNLVDKVGKSEADKSPARYALCEIVNLHDSSLEFEAIHRVCFNVEPVKMLNAMHKYYKISSKPSAKSQKVIAVYSGKEETFYIENPSHTLPVGSLQNFLDYYIKNNGGEVDYIHGSNVVKELTAQKNSIGFLLPCMDKNDLFKTVILDGSLPRKTFSMGEACDKRFYFEARKIR